VHNIAKDLGIDAKAIVAKCQAEGVPKVETHMSVISAGLEATIKEWFSEHGSPSAIETAERVDLDRVRAKKRPAQTRAVISPSLSDPTFTTEGAEPVSPAASSADSFPAAPYHDVERTRGR
jgi:hypothetical protein